MWWNWFMKARVSTLRRTPCWSPGSEGLNTHHLDFHGLSGSILEETQQRLSLCSMKSF